MSGPSRLHRNLLIGVVCFAGLAVAMVLTLRIGVAMGWSQPARIIAGTAGAAALVLLWGLFAIRLNRSMDEYQRWREQRAWYVGGLAGLLLSVPAYAFVGLGGLHWLFPATDAGPAAARAFSSGYMLALFMPTAGAVIYGLWTRLARR
ncbi:MAG: hypothetical protein GC203_15220 [Phenylobacterium sp.]|uniref:hypothetical protein n=1 Tax=Phenylobacterium sp. TaxID=1871053 RepID=UPI0025D76D6D|nr:hypothetical protein [Phenylobacterium sp.]MBI1199209.1 hypothetical protein [Phenylobacterium sp.]